MSARAITVLGILNVLAAVGVFVWCGLASGVSQAAMMGRWSMLEHARVLNLEPAPVVEGVKDTSKWGLFDYLTSGLVEALHATTWVACIIPALNAIALVIIATRLRQIAHPLDDGPLNRIGGSDAGEL